MATSRTITATSSSGRVEVVLDRAAAIRLGREGLARWAARVKAAEAELAAGMRTGDAWPRWFAEDRLSQVAATQDLGPAIRVLPVARVRPVK